MCEWHRKGGDSLGGAVPITFVRRTGNFNYWVDISSYAVAGEKKKKSQLFFLFKWWASCTCSRLATKSPKSSETSQSQLLLFFRSTQLVLLSERTGRVLLINFPCHQNIMVVVLCPRVYTSLQANQVVCINCAQLHVWKRDRAVFCSGAHKGSDWCTVPSRSLYSKWRRPRKRITNSTFRCVKGYTRAERHIAAVGRLQGSCQGPRLKLQWILWLRGVFWFFFFSLVALQSPTLGLHPVGAHWVTLYFYLFMSLRRDYQRDEF